MSAIKDNKDYIYAITQYEVWGFYKCAQCGKECYYEPEDLAMCECKECAAALAKQYNEVK